MSAQSSTKAIERELALDARKARSAQEISSARAAIVEAVRANWRTEWRVVAAFEPLRTEPGSVELLHAAADLGARVLVPVTQADRDLDWRMWPSGSLLGPAAIGSADVVFVPALAVDHAGVRLGRGGGSYDRALLRRGAATLVVAVLFDGEFVRGPLPHDEWDQPVGAVVTPSGWRSPLGVDGE
ncbi:MAG: 5-formyltetrahydrofolate cyclo-ligase [Actinobacteria bacterium]|nr:5-formyltetrahydrofolate cyclo-ligase [Actinomycetota bacterium]